MRRPAVAALVSVLAAAPAAAQDAPRADPPAAAPIVPAKWLVLESPDVRARRPLSPSAVFARHLLDRDAPPPAEGEEVVGERGVPVKWTAVETKDGAIPPGNASVGFAVVPSDRDQVVIARVHGAAALWVNGDPFAGDVYGYGFEGVPVLLRKGENRVFVSGFRGAVRVSFTPAAEGVRAVAWDATLPTVDREAPWGETGTVDAGVVLVNSGRESVVATPVSAGAKGDAAAGPSVRLLPLGVTKAPCRPSVLTDESGAASVAVGVAGGPPGGAVKFPLGLRDPDAPHRLTRISGIDGSVQESAVVEPAPSVAPVRARVVLSLHGAGVDCLGQARSYSRRPGFWIVCPTNRRPFGFDWQDWGRLDAYEALAHASERFAVELDRVFLTGHSMGGHGTWHLAANDPDRFLAIAPSAGWASFDTYAGGPRPRTMLWPVWSGADATSDTLALVPNLAPLPTLVVHGTKDDNVPLGQAETMLAALRAAGGAPSHHFQEGAGHWWDGDAAPGADCVDLPAIFRLFESVDRAGPPLVLDWTTADPSVDSRHHWLQVMTPLVYGTPIRIRAAWDAARAVCTVTTANARRINLAPPDADRWTAVLDGREIPVAGPNVWFERHSDGWMAKANVQDERKKPTLAGPLKRAFARRFAAVLPTKGDEAETRETVARVRFDGQAWWIRANGFWDVVLDTEVLADPVRFEGRNLLLYGNADTNAAWGKVLGDRRPVDVRRGSVTVGARRWATDSAACFFVRPRADDAMGLAAALGDTGPRGSRVAMGHALFSSGTGYPDYLAWDERTFTLGDGGVLAAGWFDVTWDLDGRGFFAFGGEPEPAAPPGGR